MIEGIRIEMGGQELHDHLVARADHHAERAAWYQGQIAALRSGGLKAEDRTNDPVSSLERSEREHREKAAFFHFLAEHLIMGETYRLSETDLSRIEIAARWF